MHEWQQNKGDVFTLWLTEEAMQELNSDSAGFQGKSPLGINRNFHDLAMQESYDFSVIINPMTRTAVRLRVAKDNCADVCTPSGQVYTREL